MKILNRRDLDYKVWPPKAVWVDRQHSPLGNPYRMTLEEGRLKVIEQYEEWLWDKVLVEKDPRILTAMRTLTKDSILVCWCAPRRCHAEVIVKVWKELFEHEGGTAEA